MKDKYQFTKEEIGNMLVSGVATLGHIELDQSITVSNVVQISLKDGSIKYLDGFTTVDQAAKEFWDAVSLYARGTK